MFLVVGKVQVKQWQVSCQPLSSVSVDGVGLDLRKVSCFQKIFQAEMSQILEGFQETFIKPSEPIRTTSPEGTTPFHSDFNIL